MDIREYNRRMWDKQVEYGNIWTIPVTPEVIAAARCGEWSVVLTETRPVPRSWFPQELHGVEVLCLASGGGQQGPILAAAGAHVTVLDNSPRQLEQDRTVAEREGLVIHTIEGDMRDLSGFDNESFDLVFHPISNVFVPEVCPIWQETYRVLRWGGNLLAGFMNPAMFLFDYKLAEQGNFQARYKLPFDSRELSEQERAWMFGDDSPLEFSHSLEEQIGGQLAAGFLLTDLYEDVQKSAIGEFMPAYIATRAIKQKN